MRSTSRRLCGGLKSRWADTGPHHWLKQLLKRPHNRVRWRAGRFGACEWSVIARAGSGDVRSDHLLVLKRFQRQSHYCSVRLRAYNRPLLDPSAPPSAHCRSAGRVGVPHNTPTKGERPLYTFTGVDRRSPHHIFGTERFNGENATYCSATSRESNRKSHYFAARPVITCDRRVDDCAEVSSRAGRILGLTTG